MIHDLGRGRLPDMLLQPLAASLGAFLATAAVTAMYFGVLRPVGIIAGLVIIPLTTVFMAAAMVYLALIFLLPVLAVPVGMLLSVLYALLERIVSRAAAVPGISGPVWVVVCLSLGLFAALTVLWRQRMTKRLRLAPFELPWA
jgi:competence protein ComEC